MGRPHSTEQAKINTLTKCFVVIALTAWAIMLAQYLGWTQVGATVIAGVQGRYFLSLLPFLAVAIFCLRPLRLPGLGAVPLAAGIVSAATVPVVAALASFVH